MARVLQVLSDKADLEDTPQIHTTASEALGYTILSQSILIRVSSSVLSLALVAHDTSS